VGDSKKRKRDASVRSVRKNDRSTPWESTLMQGGEEKENASPRAKKEGGTVR